MDVKAFAREIETHIHPATLPRLAEPKGYPSGREWAIRCTSRM